MSTPILLLCSPWWMVGPQPFLAGVGDSWQGTSHEGGIPTGQPMYWMAQALPGLEFVRYSQGGETYAWVAANAMPSAVASGARAIIAISGGNDLASSNGPRTYEEMLADLDTMSAMLNPGQHLFVSEIGPGSFSSGHLNRIDEWNNNQLPAWCAANDATVLLINAALRDTDRTLLPEYDLDGLHLTSAGVLVLAAQWLGGVEEYYT